MLGGVVHDWTQNAILNNSEHEDTVFCGFARNLGKTSMLTVTGSTWYNWLKYSTLSICISSSDMKWPSTKWAAVTSRLQSCTGTVMQVCAIYCRLPEKKLSSLLSAPKPSRTILNSDSAQMEPDTTPSCSTPIFCQSTICKEINVIYRSLLHRILFSSIETHTAIRDMKLNNCFSLSTFIYISDSYLYYYTSIDYTRVCTNIDSAEDPYGNSKCKNSFILTEHQKF